MIMRDGFKIISIITLIMLAVCPLMAADGQKVLFIDSYHEGYPWSDGITNGIKEVIGDKAELKVHRMDTKRNTSEEFKKKAAEEAKALIEQWQPDVVIAADDNASKYLIEPFYKGKELPFVFCGVNWDASAYGFPTDNVCGMVEVDLIEPVLKQMKSFAKGDRIGYIASDNLTTRKEGEFYKKKFDLNFTEEVYVKSFSDWKKAFEEMQGKVDMIIVGNNAGLDEWKDDEAKALAVKATKVPSGCVYDWMMPVSLVGFTKLGEEQGQWAAGAALRILEGASPKDIGVTQNKKGQLYVNLPVAKALGVTFPLSTLKAAEVIKQ